MHGFGRQIIPMSLPSDPNSTQSTDNELLRFGCPACGVRLVVDQSIAGTQGPCPSCGASIVAPPLGSARDLSNRGAAPLEVKPRNKGGTEKTTEMAGPEGSPSGSIPEPDYKASRKRSVSPSAVISDRHTERGDTLAFFKILCAVLVVALIVAAVFLWLKNAS